MPMFKMIPICMLAAAGAMASDIAVMAPLDPLTDPALLDDLLAKVHDAGATSISVDVWWGRTERQRGVFDWTQYDALFQRIDAHHLAITPILSFHACGGNVGDDCDIPIPSWVWGLPSGTGKVRGYFDAQGREDKERVPPWHQRAVLGEYEAWMRAFRAHYESKGVLSKFHEINVSLGPSGELRYPAYATVDKNPPSCGYPTAGCFQFPAPGPHPSDTLTDSFERSYQETLFRGGRELLALADKVFDGSAQSLRLGFKWPGLHWGWGHWSDAELNGRGRPARPFGVLYTSGLLRDVGSPGIDESDFQGALERFLQGIPAKVCGRLILHFTSLEQQDAVVDKGVLAWAKPQELVHWMLQAAQHNSIAIKGENALDGNLSNRDAWGRIGSNLGSGYSGITLLRLESFADPAVLQSLRDLTRSACSR